jgi:minor capsid protein|nr:MAG TPA: minor capsid protein [Caudoviricetes sp.]
MELKNNDGNYWVKSKEVEGLYHELSMEIMKNIVRRLKQRGTADLIDNPYVWQLEKLNDLHLITEENVKLISKYSGVAEEVFRDVIANEGFKIYQDSHQQLAQALKSDATPNPLVQDSLNSLAKQTMFEVNNLINTTMPKALQKNYKQTLESAVAGVVSGTKSHEKALSEAVLKMYERGFTAFRDRGGRMWTVERYAKTVIRTTTFRTYREMRERPADDLGIDTYYYSAKSSARELCAPLQHQIVTKGVARTINGEKVLSLPDYGFGSPGGCLGINCGHYLTPFVVGVNYKPQLPEYLQNLTEDEAKQNALDKARLKAFDREIRINKDKQILAKELGDKELQAKLKLKEKTFKTGRKSLIEKNPTVIGKPPKKVVEDESKKTNINNKTTMKSIEDKPKKVYNKDRIVFKTLTENDLPRILEESGKIAYDDRNPIYYRITGGYVATKNSFKINMALRQGRGDSLNDYDKLTISTLDKVIKSNTLKENIILTRYAKMDIIDAITEQNSFLKDVTSEKEMLKLINKNTAVLNDKGFVSTSVVPELNYFKQNPIRFKIHAEKGQNVYMTDNFEESEMILPRNSNFVITKAAIVDEKIEFTINIVKENNHEN